MLKGFYFVISLRGNLVALISIRTCVWTEMGICKFKLAVTYFVCKNKIANYMKRVLMEFEWAILCIQRLIMPGIVLFNQATSYAKCGHYVDEIEGKKMHHKGKIKSSCMRAF